MDSPASYLNGGRVDFGQRKPATCRLWPEMTREALLEETGGQFRGRRDGPAASEETVIPVRETVCDGEPHTFV